MPYEIVNRDDEYCVVVEESGETLGCHPTREEAEDQMQAVAIAEKKMSPKTAKAIIEVLTQTEFNLEAKQDSYKPTQGMVNEARKGLEWREEYGRGGTQVGVARARDIVNGSNLSADTVKRMFSFFSRHEDNKDAEGFSPGEDGYPSAGRIAWALWGGDPGFSWSRKIAERLDGEEKAAPGDLSTGDFVSWNSSGGRSQGRITRIVRDGEIDVPDSSFTIEGTEDDPAALIRVYQEGEDGWEASDTQVGHRFSTLRKIGDLS